MQVFRDLFIRGDTDQLVATMQEVERSLTDGWSRDVAVERDLQSRPLRKEQWYCFSCERQGRRPAAMVSITEKEPRLLYVPNVVPREQHDLSFDEYNAILGEFCDRFVRPAASRTEVQVELTDNQAELERWLSSQAAEKLRRFSAAANKSTGSSHPCDQDRWMDFIVTAHREGGQFDAHTLRRWLVEVAGWPPEVASRLELEYEFGREVLAFADGRRLSA